ncbi:MAG TPA: SDR family oxidoreductase [Pseudosphingobacterium sp.]|nr:SDR family oxidoreductase [Pseudosphingobacterium sp.]
MKKDKNYALITGATNGIGYELAKIFAQNGYDLVLVARNLEELNRTAAELSQYNIEIAVIAKDLFDKDAPAQVYDEVRLKGLIIDVLVNDAGQGVYGKFIETDLQRELNIVQLNINACVMLTKFFLKDMLLRGNGKILNLSSIAGKMPGPYQAVYHGTKAFVHFFSEAIHNEVSDSGVTVTSLLPGATDTDFFRKANMENAKIVQKGQLEDPATVAKDGYEALMAGKDMVISGFKNKVQVGMSNVMPDSKVTDKMGKNQEPLIKESKNRK